jgi:nitrogen fixation NifU-like protein
MDLYADNILEHYRNPRNKNGGDGSWNVTHKELNASCGDEITVHMNIEDDKISAISWDGIGCAISQAAMSMLSEELLGMTVEDTEKLTQNDVLELLGVPISARRLQCALLGLKGIQKSLQKAVITA